VNVKQLRPGFTGCEHAGPSSACKVGRATTDARIARLEAFEDGLIAGVRVTKASVLI